MRLKFGLLAGVFALALTVGVAPTASGQGHSTANEEEGAWICHQTGSGVKLHWSSATSLEAHFAHGDDPNRVHPGRVAPPADFCL